MILTDKVFSSVFSGLTLNTINHGNIIVAENTHIQATQPRNFLVLNPGMNGSLIVRHLSIEIATKLTADAFIDTAWTYARALHIMSPNDQSKKELSYK